MFRVGLSLLQDLCPGPLNFVDCGPISGSSAVGQHKAHLCLVPVLNGYICSLGHIPGLCAKRKLVLELLKGTYHTSGSSCHWLSHSALIGFSTNSPNKKQGLDLLLGTHTGCILLGLIFVMLLHADFHKGLIEEGGRGRR